MRVRLGLAIVVITAALCMAACHDEGHVAVKSLSFTGNATFDDARLAGVLATQSSGWLPWSPKHYFKRQEFDADLRRLQGFYADRGFPNARIAGIDVKLNAAKDAAALTIAIAEGDPLILESVETEGFDDLPDHVRAALAAKLPKAGTPRDREVVRAGQALGVHLLRDNGYAHAAVTVVEQASAQPNRVGLRLRADPGPKSYFGEVAIAGLVSVDEHVVRRELAFSPGDLYRESALTRSQQQLTNLELFDFAHVDPRVEDDQATQIPVRVTLAESKTQRLKLGVGLGSEERVRGSLEWKHLNLFGRAQQLATNAKYSYLERGVRFSFLQPYVFRKELSLDVSGTAWHTSELTYETGTYGGRATLTYHQDAARSGGRKPVHHEFRLGYVNEYVRYGITADSLDDQSRRAERIALGLDPDTGKGAGTVGAIDFGLERTAIDDAADPHRGTTVSGSARIAARALGGTYHYKEAHAEARAYLPFGPRIVFANRIQAGTVVADTPADMPFSERYFLGGSTSVRGWGRFEVSPLDSQGLPVGGLSMAEWSSEIRFPVRGKISAVAFLDAGNVWAGSRVFEVTGLRYAIGPGIRYLTPVGALRADLGYQLNRIPGLVINGAPEGRQWRLHFSIGQSF